jgi:hypothetical protein
MSFRNRLVLPIILSSLAVLAGCGSSSSPVAVPPPTGNFSNSDLNGTYVFSVTGSDVNFDFLTMVGTLTANGSGGITGGTVDINDSEFSAPVVNNPITGGTYKITSDGRGQATLSTSTPFGSSIIVDFVLTSNTQGLITEYDGNATGSGTLTLQSAVTQSQIAASYAFNFTGISSINPSTGAQPSLSTVGAFTLDSSGNVISGVEDLNNDGNSAGQANLTITSGFVSLASVPGTANLTTTAGSLNFDVYPIDATHLKFIETDAFPILAGDIFTQSSSIPTSSVFTLAGLDFVLQGPFTAAGVIVTDGTSLVTSGSAEDINDAGNPFQVSSFTGSFTALSSGRSVFTLNGFGNGNSGLTGTYQFAAYPSSGGMQLLEIDNLGTTDGVAFTQTTGAALASAQGFGFNLTGINAGSGTGTFEEDDIGEFTNNSGTLTGLIDFNDQGATTFDQSFAATYAADSTISGRGVIAPTTNAFNLVSYLVDSSTAVFVEMDTNQLGLGSFGLQTPTAKSNVAAMHLVALHLKPGAKNALRRKKK